MEIRIRRARRTDYSALAALGAWPAVEGSAARSVRLFRRVVSDLAYDVYVAEDDRQPIGFVAVSYIRALALGGQRATLEDLVVHPEFRGRGLARRLFDFVRQRAERRGVRAFEAGAESESAERFLEHLGFRPRGRCHAWPIGRGGPA